MSERLRSSSSRSSLSIETPNRSLQTLPFHTVSNVWSLSPAAGWGVEHRDLCSSEAQCSCQTVANTAREWLNNHRQLQQRLTRNFISCYTSKFTPQGSSSWRDSAEAFRLVVFLTNEWNVCLTRQYQSHRALLQYHGLHHEYVVAWDFCGACHFLWHMAANVFHRYWMALLSAASL